MKALGKMGGGAQRGVLTIIEGNRMSKGGGRKSLDNCRTSLIKRMVLGILILSFKREIGKSRI